MCCEPLEPIVGPCSAYSSKDVRYWQERSGQRGLRCKAMAQAALTAGASMPLGHECPQDVEFLLDNTSSMKYDMTGRYIMVIKPN